MRLSHTNTRKYLYYSIRLSTVQQVHYLISAMNMFVCRNCHRGRIQYIRLRPQNPSTHNTHIALRRWSGRTTNGSRGCQTLEAASPIGALAIEASERVVSPARPSSSMKSITSIFKVERHWSGGGIAGKAGRFCLLELSLFTKILLLLI